MWASVGLRLCMLLDFVLSLLAQDWGYEAKNGPDKWPEMVAACDGKQQSPIFINSNHTQYSSSLTAFDLRSYDDVPPHAHWEMVNEGTTLKVDIAGGEYLIRDGDLDGDYQAAQFHWHWGSDDSQGAEHVLDGYKAPMELHVVHYSTKYKSLEEARKKRDGIASFAFLYRLGKFDHPGYNQIVKFLDNITYPGDHITLRPINMLSLLPMNLNNYFRYSGSMTTPPCTENVVWSVFKDPVIVSYNQMKAIRSKLMSTNPNLVKQRKLVDNFRRPQLLNDRVVYSSDPSHERGLTLSSPVSITLAAMVGMAILLFFLRR